MRRTVKKFGGTSLADAEAIQHVVSLIQEDPNCLAVVVSAPGKRSSDDTKITDLLIKQRFGEVRTRFEEILAALPVSEETARRVRGGLRKLERHHDHGRLISRGEYFCAQIVADLLGPGWAFVDAAGL